MKKRFGAFLCIIVLLSMLTVFTSACSGSDGYKITFYDGENVIETITTKGKEAITLPTEPAKVGYTFGGFYLDKAFATQITADSFKDKKLEAEISVYTKWTANTYEITFDIAGGVGEVAKATAVYNSAMPTLLSSAPTKVGYAFGGFYDKAVDGIKYYNADLTSAKTFDKTEAVALVAVWVASENTVTFNANSGVGENYSQTIKSDTTAALTANTFTKTGYTFAGWATEATGKVAYADGANYTMSTASVTLYAVWTANKYDITFNIAGGVGEVANVTATYDSAMPQITTAPSKVGYTFGGFYDNATGLVKYYNADLTSAKTFDKTEAVALIAVWTANTYDITFDIAGGVGAVASVTATYDSAMPTLSSSAPTKVGYTFGGFYDNATGGVMYYNADLTSARTFDKAAATTLVAVWTANDNTVTFNANSGTGNDYSQTINSDTTVALTANTFTKTGYTFDGWATTAGGKVAYADGVNYPMGTASVTLYAVWTANTYEISFNIAGGSGAVASVTATYDSAMPTLSSSAPTKVGYTFGGFYDNATGGVKYYNADLTSAKTFDKTEATTLVAVWTANTYEITFNIAGGVGAVAKVTATYDSAMPKITSNAPTKVGYTFGGFYDNATGLVKYYNADLTSAKIFDKTEAVALIAVWTANDNTVTFNANTGTGNNYSQTIKSDTTVALTANTFTKTGYTFAGWATTATSGVVYNDKENYKMGTASVTLYAVWTANKYEITFNIAGGNGAVANVTATYDSVMPKITSNAPTKVGYTFGGFYDKATGGKKYYKADLTSAKTFDKAAATTLVAVWVANTYTVKFEYDGATGNNTVTGMSITYDASFTCPVPTKTNYAFQGWYKGTTQCTDEKGASILTSYTEANDATLTFTAKWELETTGMTFEDINGTTTRLKTYTGKAKYVVIPASYNGKAVVEIGTAVFKYNDELISITIPASVERIMNEAFWYCSNLATVTILPQSKLNHIGDRAFKDCKALKAFTIPKGVTFITSVDSTYNAFMDSGIETFTVEDGNNTYKVTDNCIIDIANKTLVAAGCINSVIPTDGSVTAIGNGAFASNKQAEIVIPSNVTTIGIGAFSSCSATKITLSEGLTTIGTSAFANCNNLTSITIPASVTTIDTNAFLGCTALTNIVVVADNKNYKSVEGNLYSKDGSILIQYALGKTATNFTIPASVTTIEANAFQYCKLTSVTIPANVTTMGNAVFYDCSSMTTINCFASSKPEGWNTNWKGNCPANVVWNYKG